jgi:2-aminoadipate transaminase
MANPRIINFAAGLVDPLTLPVDECAEITRKIFADAARGRVALQYDTTIGSADLRRAMLEHMERLEGKPAGAMGLTADDIVITTGSQQALYLIGEVLLDPGDIVIDTNPSYFVYTGALSSFGARVLAVPTDDDGMDVQAVARLLEQVERDGDLDRVKFIYCTSYFQNPTGLTLSRQRREKLLDIARRFSRGHRILILEDAAYRELRYDGDALPSIKSFDAENRYTILAHTFSKPFAPGIKTGYTAMPRDLMDAVLHHKGNHDFGSPNVSQQIALEAMRDGSYAEHVEVLRTAYRAKRDAVLSALEKFIPSNSGVTWTHPHGGLYVWLTLPEQVDTSRGSAFFNACVEAGVLYVPGAYCFQPDADGRIPVNHLRLSFGQVAPEQIEPGIQRLSSVVRSRLSIVNTTNNERRTTNKRSSR